MLGARECNNSMCLNCSDDATLGATSLCSPGFWGIRDLLAIYHHKKIVSKMCELVLKWKSTAKEVLKMLQVVPHYMTKADHQLLWVHGLIAMDEDRRLNRSMSNEM